MKYQVFLSSKVSHLKDGDGIIVIEPDDYTSDQVKAIKKKGYKVLAYLSVGTLEKERSWYSKYKSLRLKRLEDWQNEWYVDVRKKAWRKFLYARAEALKKKGFDGLWCDNLDVYEYCKSTAMANACYTALTNLKKYGFIMVNGGAEFFEYAMKKVDLKVMVNGVTQEEVFSLIKDYDGKGKFGTQTKEMHDYYVGYLKKLKKRGIKCFLLEYTRDDKLKTKIKDFCKKEGMSYYISEDVDL